MWPFIFCDAIRQKNSRDAQRLLQRVNDGVSAIDAELQSAYSRFDFDGTGSLDMSEAKYMCAYVGLSPADVKLVDTNQDQLATIFAKHSNVVSKIINLLILFLWF